MRSTKSKAIGIVGGMGPYAGMDLERKVFDAVKVSGDQDYPDVMMISMSRVIPDRTNYILHPETENPCIGICHCIQKLAEMGATHIAIPCNTAHSPIIMEQVRRYIELNSLEIKLFNIIEETHKWVQANCAARDIMLFGTRGTYCSGEYRRIFEAGGSHKIFEPDEPDKKLIWDAIYSKEFGIKAFSNPVKDKAVENFQTATENAIARRFDTFIMGCTEIPLAMGRLRLPITKIDPAKILARALVAEVCPEKLKAE